MSAAYKHITPFQINTNTAGYTDYDISANLPAGTSGVAVRVIADNVGTAYFDIGWSMPGASDDPPVGRFYDNNQTFAYMGVSDGKVRISRGHADAEYWVVGVFHEDHVVFLSTPSSRGGPGTDWTDFDISGLTGADTAIWSIGYVRTGGTRFGIRRKGWSNNPVGLCTRIGGFIIPCDANEIYQAKGADGDIYSHYVYGYFKSGVETIGTPSSYTAISTGTWETIETLGDGYSAGLYLWGRDASTGAYDVGIRQVGNTDTIHGKYLGGGYHFISALMEGGTDNEVEGQTSSTTVIYHRMGYILAEEGEVAVSHVEMSIPSGIFNDEEGVKYQTILGESAGASPLGRGPTVPGLFMAYSSWFGFYATDIDVVYRSKQIAEGGNWSAEKTAIAGISDGYNFNAWQDGNYIHLAYGDSVSQNLLYKRGELQSDGTITWGSEQTVVTGGVEHRWMSIITEQNGNPIIGYVARPDGNYQPRIVVSTTSGTWTTKEDYPQDLQAAYNYAWHGQGMSLALISDNNILVTFYDRVNTRQSARLLNLSTNVLGSLEDIGIFASFQHQRTSMITHGDGTAMVNCAGKVAYRDSGGVWYDRSPLDVPGNSYNGLTICNGRVQLVYRAANQNDLNVVQTSDNGLHWTKPKTKWLSSNINAYVPSQVRGAGSTQYGSREYHAVMWTSGESLPREIIAGIDEVGFITPLLLISPIDLFEGINPINILYEIDKVGEAGNFDLQVADNAQFTTPVIDVSNQSGNTYQSAITLNSNVTYYWRARVLGSNSEWVQGEFTTEFVETDLGGFDEGTFEEDAGIIEVEALTHLFGEDEGVYQEDVGKIFYIPNPQLSGIDEGVFQEDAGKLRYRDFVMPTTGVIHIVIRSRKVINIITRRGILEKHRIE